MRRKHNISAGSYITIKNWLIRWAEKPIVIASKNCRIQDFSQWADVVSRAFPFLPWWQFLLPVPPQSNFPPLPSSQTVSLQNLYYNDNLISLSAVCEYFHRFFLHLQISFVLALCPLLVFTVIIEASLYIFKLSFFSLVDYTRRLFLHFVFLTASQSVKSR